VRPRVDLAAAAGLDLDDGIVTDGAGRTSHPAVWAAGDVARVDGQRVEHWHAAREAGARVARSLLGTDVGSNPVPWVFSEVTGVGVDVVGAPDPGAEERRFGEGVVAWLRDGGAAGIAVVGGVMTAAEARNLVASGASAAQVKRSVEAAGA
jgi:NAD(P)H-nitrite reductase large subunit